MKKHKHRNRRQQHHDNSQNRPTITTQEKKQEQAVTHQSEPASQVSPPMTWRWPSTKGLFDFLLVILTSVLAITSCLQWGVTQQSADAAKKSADTAAKALTVIERGRLEVQVLFEKDAGNEPLLVARVNNVGKSPVRFEDLNWSFKVGGLPGFPKPPVYHAENSRTQRASYTIHPTATWDVVYAIDAAKKPQLTEVEHGTIQFLVWGFVTYRDVFDCWHWSKFGMAYEPRFKTFKTTGEPDYNEDDWGDKCATSPPQFQ